jgi:small GTP-binding protein
MKNGLSDIFHQLERFKKTISSVEIIEKINALLSLNETFANPRMRLVLCGRFNSGKSALINALLGKRLLISKMIPSTGSITRIYYSTTPFLKIIYKNGKEDKFQSLDIEQIKSYTVKNNFSNANNDNIKEIACVEIGLDNEFLKNKIEIIDTPGLNDTEDMTNLTLSQLDRGDFAIFVIDASLLLDLKELLSHYYKYLGKNVMFVVNRMDFVPNDADKRDIRDLAKVHFSDYWNTATFNSELCFVSSKEDDPDIASFVESLKKLFSKGVEKISQTSRLSILQYYLDEIYSSIKGKIAELDKQILTSDTNKKNLRDERESLRKERQFTGELINKIIKLKIKFV